MNKLYYLLITTLLFWGSLCSTSLLFSQDTDGDGIANSADIDDDNDGILDSLEVLNCSPTNLALSGTASLSTTLGSGLPINAIDNNFTNLAETNNTNTNEWLNIDLGSDQTIGSIVVHNRTTCCSERLSNVYVMVSSTAFPISSTDVSGSLSNAEFTYQIGDATGIANFTIPVNIDARYIHIQKSGTNGGDNYLNIHEVEVFETCDTDNDGTPNYLDLDSDSDGCSDAFEVGATINETANYQFSDVSGDPDGLSPTVDPGGDGTPDYTATLSQVTDGVASCDCPNSSGIDTDGDGVDNTCDLDDDNDGILDSDECSRVETGTFSISNGVTQTFNFASATDGFTIDISSLDNSFNMTINGTKLVPGEIQFANIAYVSGESLVRFASDNSLYGKSGNSSVWGLNYKNANPSLISLRLNIAANGVISLQGIRTSSSTLEELIIDGSDPQFNNIIWNASASNTVVVSQSVNGPTFLYAQGYGVNCNNDTDKDGIPNNIDLDSDDDGITDLVEIGGIDADGDGEVDDPTDSDGDGLADTFETADGSTSILFDTDGDGTTDNDRDSDSDGYPDYIDIDADNDGIVDNTEAQETSSYVPPSGIDTDEDGIDDTYDVNCVPCGAVTGRQIEPVNNGGNLEPDYLDNDSDGDGKSDVLEGHDTNNDGVVDGNDTPFASTGLAGGSTDSDADGLLDGFDNNLLAFDATNGSLTGNSHPDTGGPTSERDWREDVRLPVEWLDFRVLQKQGDAILGWATATELNADYYGIERSIDGAVFQEIGQKNASGTTTEISEYQFTDKNLNQLPVDQIFYRLRQVDLDGAFEYSRVLELSLTDNGPELSANVIPIPAADWITIQYKLLKTPSAEIDVLTSLGQKIYHKSVKEPSGELKILVETWVSGIYYVRFIGENSREIFKVQVQH